MNKKGQRLAVPALNLRTNIRVEVNQRRETAHTSNLSNESVGFRFGHLAPTDGIIQEVAGGQIGDALFFTVGCHILRVATAHHIVMIKAIHHAGTLTPS